MLSEPTNNVRNDIGGLQIRLLGGLQLFMHDVPIKFAAPLKASALLAYLIVKRSRTMPRDTIAFALWPDEDEAKARANLRRHIAMLQHVLPTSDPPVILADQRSIRWNTEFDPIVDLCEFERLSAFPGGASAAVALYAGDLLPAVYDEWLMTERERLRMLQSANLERLTEGYRRDGDYPNAIRSGKMLLDHDPWREDTLRRIMMLRYESGDRAGALQEYEQFTRRLQTDLQVAPMPETIACFESILRNAPVHLAASGSPSTASSADVMPFVATRPSIWRLPGRRQPRLRPTSCPLSVARKNLRHCKHAGYARCVVKVVPSSSLAKRASANRGSPQSSRVTSNRRVVASFPAVRSRAKRRPTRRSYERYVALCR